DNPIRFIDPDGRFVAHFSSLQDKQALLGWAKSREAMGEDDDGDPWEKWRQIFSMFGFNVTNSGIERSEDKEVLIEQANMRRAAQQVGETIETLYEMQKAFVTSIPGGSGAIYIAIENRNGQLSGIETNEQLLYAAIGFIPGGKAAKGVSVIGPRSTYREFAKKIGANFLDVTDEAWTMRENVKFLQGVVKRGDDVIFAGKYNPARLDPNSVLAQEIRYLQRHGYSWTDDFSRMIKK
ncbi:hypothetical protein SAMN05421747_1523, partial [Parapedobacter composti]